MNIPPFVYVQFVDNEGYLTNPMQLFIDELVQALQNGLSDNGWTFPKITHDNLVKVLPDGVTLFWQSMPDGTGWYEIDNNLVVFKINGALRKVTTTAYP